MTREEFIKEINSIWFITRWKFPNEFICDSKWEKTFIRIRMDSFEYRISESIVIYWHFDKIKTDIFEEKNWKTLTIEDINWWDNSWFFIQFYSKTN